MSETALHAIADIGIGFCFVGLFGTEALGVIARRYGFITISETARKSRPVRVAIALLFIVGFFWWWFFHTHCTFPHCI